MLRSGRLVLVLAVGLALAPLVAGCDVGAPVATPPIRPGSSSAPREVNLILKDWLILPDPVDVVPGESVLFHVVNGGLEIHEVVIGDGAVQAAWEAAESAAANPPPGPTPVVTVPAGQDGVRAVVPSGQRVDVAWTVPAEPSGVAALLLGCHIPGHWDKGMHAAFRIASRGG
jgi:uncharacterized cupredoxin-like copper-binding protein